MKCAYCELPEIKAREIARNTFARAILTNLPVVTGHTLVMPIRCIKTSGELTQEELLAIFDLKEKLLQALRKTFFAEGFNFAWNEGEKAGQTVPHFHLQILPRREGDTGITKYEPREFLYRPGSIAKHPEEELRQVAEIIKKSL